MKGGIKIEEEKKLSLKEKVDILTEAKDKDNVKVKKFRLPRKGKLSRSKIKKGYTTILRVDENGNVAFEKQKIEGSTYRLSTKECHVTNGKDVLSYKGRPFIIQPVKKLNPYYPNDAKNETYGQKQIMARMLNDVIRVKGAGAKPILWLIGVGVVVYIGYSIFAGGF